MLTAAVAIGAAATAIWVEVQARKAERKNLPAGEFIDIDGVRLHYLMRGDGPSVVLLHGNTVTHADIVASGLIDRACPEPLRDRFRPPGLRAQQSST